jgi:hypothetical protein
MLGISQEGVQDRVGLVPYFRGMECRGATVPTITVIRVITPAPGRAFAIVAKIERKIAITANSFFFVRIFFPAFSSSSDSKQAFRASNDDRKGVSSD